MGLLATPLGWLMKLVYDTIGLQNYFLTIFLFTLVTRIILFLLSLKNQKSQMDRARLAPRLERIQKKYGKDQQKLMQKQQELYEKEGVSQFGGCLPSIITMIVLFGVIAVIYSPLTYLIQIPKPVVQAAISASTLDDGEKNDNKFTEKDMRGYYGEFRMLERMEANKDDILKEIKNELIDSKDTIKADAKEIAKKEKISEKEALKKAQAAAEKEAMDKATDYFDQMEKTKTQFRIFGSKERSFLENPWRGGVKDISILWIFPIFAALSQLFMTMVSMRYTKRATQSTNEMQQAQGCTNVMMYGMPIFSLIIGFTFPAGVSIYWVSSSLIGVLQTVILYKIYDPAKAREQAEIEFREARKRRAEDKKRLAEARKRQDAEESAPDVKPEDVKSSKKKKDVDVTPDELEED